MNGFPKVQLVTAPAVDAAVLYNFNVGSDAGVGHDGFTLGAPEWSGQPGMVGGRAGYRTASFTHYVEASHREYVAELSALARVLTASDGWLLVQLSEFSRPRWLRTWRSDAAELSWENVMLRQVDEPRGQFEIPVSLTCDPWLRGERITHDLGGIPLDPATGCFKRLPDIEGDEPAPASLRVQWTEDSRYARRDMFAFAPVPDGQESALVWDIGTGDGWTAGTDTGAAESDVLFSGGSYRPVSFSTQEGLATRLTGTLNGIHPGRYKVMVRVARSDTDSLFAFRFGSTVEFADRWGEKVPVSWWASSTPHHAWVDLGDFWLPVGVPPIDLSAEALVSPEVGLQVARISGAGQARLDALMLIPASDEARAMFRDCETLGIDLNVTEVHDAENEMVYVRKRADDSLASCTPPTVRGGYGRVHPGRANALHVVGQSHPLWSNWLSYPSPDNIAEVAHVVLDYAPRYMWPDPSGA